MNITSVRNINFQKTLKAKAAIQHEGEIRSVDIFCIDDDKDVSALEKQADFWDWNRSFYLPEIFAFCPSTSSEMRYQLYTLELDGKLLAYSIIHKTEDDIEVELLEVAPAYSVYNTERKTKYVGETMMSFLASVAKKEGKKVSITEVADREKTKNFYFQLCGFDELPDKQALLSGCKLDNLISNNQGHTGKKIELIG